MDRITYVIGAGFSAPAGLPVMSNFLAKSKDLYYSDPDRFRDFGKVFEQIRNLSYAKNYYNTDLMNIEEILSIQEMSDFLDGRRLSSSFSDFIVETIEAYTPKLKIESRAANWYDNIFRGGKNIEALGIFVASLLGVQFEDFRGTPRPGPHLVKDDRKDYAYSVISLNYDMLLENYADFLKNSFPTSGIDSLEFNSEDYDPEWSTPHLAKLHGSVHTKEIVPPTWAKGTHNSIISTWKTAYQILKDSNHIRFIGYSLPVADSYLKYLLKSAVVESHHLKTLDVICIDWNGEVRSRYENFFALSNFRFKNSSIVDLAREIAAATVSGGGFGPETRNFRATEAAYESFMSK